VVVELFDQLQRTLGAAYTVKEELGGGGMSQVFLAHDNELNREVAVKVLHADLVAGVSAERFKREIMLSANLQHPHIVGVISAGETEGLPYFVMPFVEGESLSLRLSGKRKLSVRESVSILKDVARALAYAHERGIVHRDVKPGNVLLAGGSAALADFGVAKAIHQAQHSADAGSTDQLTSVGTSLGTPTYMAPEQIAGDQDTDHRADIYAFGIMAYQMLAGAPPFAGRAGRAVLAAHVTEAPDPITAVRPDLPEGLADLVMRCIEKDPARRPQSAREIADVLDDPAFVTGSSHALSSHGLGVGLGQFAKQRLVAGLAALAIVVAGLAYLFRPGSNGAGASAPLPGAIAVLPFVNVGGDEDDAYFADGMTDELIGALNKVPGLRVASRTAAFAFKDTRATPREIGETLNVSTLLEGTVRKAGTRLRVTAQLVSSGDGLAVWSDTYDREMSDVFAVQDNLARAIVGALRERLGGDVAGDVHLQRGTRDLAAYDLYLRGRFFFQKRGEEALHRALAYFEQAVAQDSSYAAAYTGMADVYAVLPLYSSAAGDSLLPLALRAVDRAIALDSLLPAAYTSRGGILNSSWRWEAGAQDLQRAIELDPKYVTAYQWYGENLLLNGRFEEAITNFQTAAELDPFSPIITALHGVALGIVGSSDEAVQMLHKAVEVDSSLAATRLMLGTVYLYGGRGTDAVRELEAARVIGDVPAVQGMLGYAYAVTGRTEEARALLASLTAAGPGSGRAAAVARIHLGLGDPSAALSWLDRAVDLRDPFFSSEPIASPIFDAVRDDPRFAEILRKVNLDVGRLTAPRF
jgi:serine/threonine-protein kinase